LCVHKRYLLNNIKIENLAINENSVSNYFSEEKQNKDNEIIYQRKDESISYSPLPKERFISDLKKSKLILHENKSTKKQQLSFLNTQNSSNFNKQESTNINTIHSDFDTVNSCDDNYTSNPKKDKNSKRKMSSFVDKKKLDFFHELKKKSINFDEDQNSNQIYLITEQESNKDKSIIYNNISYNQFNLNESHDINNSLKLKNKESISSSVSYLDLNNDENLQKKGLSNNNNDNNKNFMEKNIIFKEKQENSDLEKNEDNNKDTFNILDINEVSDLTHDYLNKKYKYFNKINNSKFSIGIFLQRITNINEKINEKPGDGEKSHNSYIEQFLKQYINKKKKTNIKEETFSSKESSCDGSKNTIIINLDSNLNLRRFLQYNKEYKSSRNKQNRIKKVSFNIHTKQNENNIKNNDKNDMNLNYKNHNKDSNDNINKIADLSTPKGKNCGNLLTETDKNFKTNIYDKNLSNNNEFIENRNRSFTDKNTKREKRINCNACNIF
jgi:hypothetical protein